MDLIATKDFTNGPQVGIDLTQHKGADGKNQAHVKDVAGNALKHHIHKGARFSIGSTNQKELKDFAASDPNRIKIQWLFFTESAKPATENNVAQVNSELEAEKVRAAADSKLNEAVKAPGLDEIVAAVTAAVLQSTGKKQAA